MEGLTQFELTHTFENKLRNYGIKSLDLRGNNGQLQRRRELENEERPWKFKKLEGNSSGDLQNIKENCEPNNQWILADGKQMSSTNFEKSRRYPLTNKCENQNEKRPLTTSAPAPLPSTLPINPLTNLPIVSLRDKSYASIAQMPPH
jgi:hypothetical protein